MRATTMMKLVAAYALSTCIMGSSAAALSTRDVELLNAAVFIFWGFEEGEEALGAPYQPRQDGRSLVFEVVTENPSYQRSATEAYKASKYQKFVYKSSIEGDCRINMSVNELRSEGDSSHTFIPGLPYVLEIDFNKVTDIRVNGLSLIIEGRGAYCDNEFGQVKCKQEHSLGHAINTRDGTIDLNKLRRTARAIAFVRTNLCKGKSY